MRRKKKDMWCTVIYTGSQPNENLPKAETY